MQRFLHARQSSRRRLLTITALLSVCCGAAVCGAAATSAATQQAGSTNLAEDNFDRPNTSAGWATTTNAHGLPNYAWSGDLGSSPLAKITGTAGTIKYTGTNGHKLAGYVATPKQVGGDALIEFSFNVVGHQQCGVIIQRLGTGQWYQADLNTSIGQLQLAKRAAQKMNFVASYPFAAVANKNYWIRENVKPTGSTEIISARVWADGTAEPSAWQVSYTDTAPLPAGYAGAMGDWFKSPGSGELESFHKWAYAVAGPAVSP